jgi:hypothetical protein
MRAKSFLLIASMSLIVGNISPISSHAADQCLAQFPDSAWSKGEPQSVSVLLNRDLVRTQALVIRDADGKNLATSIPSSGIPDIIPRYLQNSAVEYVGKVGFKEISYPVTVSYEYKGSGCSVRNIKVTGGSVLYKPFESVNLNDTQRVQEMLKVHFQGNFLELEKKVLEYAALSKLLESTRNAPIKISGTRPSDDYSLAWILGIEQAINNLGIAYNQTLITSDDDCMKMTNERNSAALKRISDSLSTIDKTFDNYSVRLPGAWEKVTFSSADKVCKLTVNFGVGGFLGPLVNLENVKKLTPVRVTGYVWVQPTITASSTASQKTTNKVKTVITCTKGKLTKKITAINPKCPAGYKLKK